MTGGALYPRNASGYSQEVDDGFRPRQGMAARYSDRASPHGGALQARTSYPY